MLLKLVHFSNVAVQEEKVADALNNMQVCKVITHTTSARQRCSNFSSISLTHQREHKTNLSEASLPIGAQKILQK